MPARRTTPTVHDPIFLDPSGRRRRLLVGVLVALLSVSLLFLATAGYALA